MSNPTKRFFFIFAFLSVLVSSAYSAKIPCVWTGVDKIIAVGDLHGDLESFEKILVENNITDENLRWIAGKTHLVQIGDILDRGPQAKDIFNLLMSLEEEAAAAGGMVHFLLGNHEELNITGLVLDYPGYVTVEQFVDFLPENFVKSREKKFIATLSDDDRVWIESHGLDLETNTSYQDYWQKIIQDKKDRESKSLYINTFIKNYGKWLLQKNIVIKINDIVFVHGGIAEKYSTWKLEDINDTFRDELEIFRMRQRYPTRFSRTFRPKLIYTPDSPLWYRDLAEKEGRATERMFQRILENMDAKYMVVGHTIRSNGGLSPIVNAESMSRFDGKLWTIDTGISSYYYGGVPTALIFEQDEFSIYPADSEELPKRSPIKPQAGEILNQEDIEVFLSTAPIAKVRKSNLPGRTDPWTVTLDDGAVTRRAVFKYIDRRRPHESQIPDSYKYDVAAYTLSKHLGLDIIPPIVEREVEGWPGTLQIFVDDAMSESARQASAIQPPDSEAFLRAMQVVRIFDNLVSNTCAEAEDTLIQKETWQVFRIDFGESFSPEAQLIQNCPIEKCPKPLYEKLLAWDEAEVSSLMAPFLNKAEMKTLHARRALIVSRIQSLIREKGEEAVIYQ